LDAEPVDEPVAPSRSHRRRRLVIAAVVFATLAVVGARVYFTAVSKQDYVAVCVDMRTQQRVPIDRCALPDQDAYQRWYVRSGERVPAVGQNPGSGGTATPTGRNIRISEDFDADGGVVE
jgi:hypothetical protein